MIPKLNNFYNDGQFVCPKSWELISSKIGGNCFIVKKDGILYMYNFCTCYWAQVVENWDKGYVETNLNWFEIYNFGKTYSFEFDPKNKSRPKQNEKVVGFAIPKFEPKTID